MSAPPLYFGCYRDHGHRLHRPGGMTVKPEAVPLPASLGYAGLDCGFTPKGAQMEGLAALHHVDGWTVLSFWDRSLDTRPGSHSTYVLPGALTFAASVEAARKAFPEVWGRYPFDVVPLDLWAPNALSQRPVAGSRR